MHKIEEGQSVKEQMKKTFQRAESKTFGDRHDKKSHITGRIQECRFEDLHISTLIEKYHGRVTTRLQREENRGGNGNKPKRGRKKGGKP